MEEVIENTLRKFRCQLLKMAKPDKIRSVIGLLTAFSDLMDSLEIPEKTEDLPEDILLEDVFYPRSYLINAHILGKLDRAGIETLGQLAKKTEEDLRSLPNMGKGQTVLIEETLEKLGFCLQDGHKLLEQVRRKPASYSTEPYYQVLGVDLDWFKNSKCKDEPLHYQAILGLRQLGVQTYGDIITLSEDDLMKGILVRPLWMDTLCRYLRRCVNVELAKSKKAEPVPQQSTSAQPPDARIEELDFTIRTYNCLKKANILTIGELVGYSEIDLTNIRNFGKKSLIEVKEKLALLGLGLRRAVEGEPPLIISSEPRDEEEKLETEE